LKKKKENERRVKKYFMPVGQGGYEKQKRREGGRGLREHLTRGSLKQCSMKGQFDEPGRVISGPRS